MATTRNGSDSSSNGTDYNPVSPKIGEKNYAHPPPQVQLTAQDALWQELFPADSWTADGVYWADLPYAEKQRFIFGEFNRDYWHTAWLEFQDFKRDPLLPAINYWRNYVLPGMGLFTEGYVLFSIGNLNGLFSAAFPTCWKTFAVCNKTWTETTTYLQIVGIIIGQSGVGIEADWIGRRFGLIQDATIMLIGIILLTSVWGAGGSLQGWVIGYALSQLIYGIGVGGEYPMTATLAMERASSVVASAQDRLHRGRRTVGAFLMQGWGQVVNQAVLIILLLISNSGGNPPYSYGVAQVTYRLSFAFIGIFVLWLLYYRIYRLRFANAALNDAKAKVNVSGYDLKSLSLAFHFFWHRLIATAFGWFANDFFFYGNKVFQGQFLSVILGGSPSVMSTWLWNLLNVFIALIGYYFAFTFIDHKAWGRVRMQTFGFAIVSIIFLCCAAAYDQLLKPGAAIHAFQFLYLFSSFWEQFGANCVTFLVAAEVYPTAIRGTGHGVSAAIGKLGALAPTIMYNYIDTRTKFWVVWPIGIAGAITTWLFLPDVTGLDLREQERRWAYMRSGRIEEYHGIACHRQHLSWYEVNVLHLDRYYNAELDRQQRLDELREIYRNVPTDEAGKAEKAQLSPAMIDFFNREMSMEKGGNHPHVMDDGLLGRGKTGQAFH